MPVDERRDVLAAWRARPTGKSSKAFTALLIAGLSDEDVPVRVVALGAYESLEGKIGLAKLRSATPRVQPTDGELAMLRVAVLTALDDPHPRVRTAAAAALRGLAFLDSDTVQPQLRRRFESEKSPTVLGELVAALGDAARGGSRLAREAVVKALSHESAEVQARAAEAAQRIPAPEALPTLKTLLNASDPRVRVSAARSIASLQPEDTDSYVRALRDRIAVERNQTVLQALYQAVKKLEKR